MQNLLDFLRRYNYLFIFVVLEVVSFVLLFRFNSYQGSVWLSAANGVTAHINNLYKQGEDYFRLKTVNTRLTEENIRLQQENAILSEALLTVTHDSTYTEKRVNEQLAGYTLIPAKVVSNKVVRGANNYIVINRGTAEGIRPEMGVVGGGGVVGIVYLTSKHHSLIIPLTHVKSSISCRVRGKNYFGYLQWDGRSTRKAHVDDVPRYAKARRGSVIETSGYSAVFPPGIFVGRVDKVVNSKDGQSYRLNVVLGNDFGNLRDVNVIATPYKNEIDALMFQADSLSER